MEGRSVSRNFRGRERFVADEAGATMTEYGLLLLFIALIVAGVARLVGTEVISLYSFGSYL
jgi:Flp pilus assembly pilin Flp